MKVSEHRLMEAVNDICDASELLSERVDRDGSFAACVARSSKRQAIFKLLMNESGWRTNTMPFSLKGGGVGTNVYAFCRNAGPTRFFFGCHSDYCAGEGANDNASGMAVLAELARHLAGTEAATHCCFGAFDMEERGLLGSRAHVLAKIAMPTYMVNVDAVSGNTMFVMQHTEKNDDLVTELWQAGEDVGVTIHPIDAKDVGISSDHIPFWNNGVPATSLFGYSPEAHGILLEQIASAKKHEKMMACSTANKPSDLRTAMDVTNMVAAVRLLIQWIANKS